MTGVLIAQAGEASLTGASLAIVIAAGAVSIIGNLITGMLSVKLEHRLTVLETKIESLPCTNCPREPRPAPPHCHWHHQDQKK